MGGAKASERVSRRSENLGGGAGGLERNLGEGLGEGREPGAGGRLQQLGLELPVG